MPSTHACGSVKSCKMRFLATSLLLTVSVGLSACANMSTVSRTTWLWPLEERAIHLDAQQRLVLVRADKYCAEPSPDALASYAAALGLGLGKPGAGAANVAQALQSNAASIGLRTQSITLMRDTLYRICEATANGTLGKVGAATALARSQDMTAVVLAIEQLTGAVAGAQVILTSEARAKASAALTETQKRLKAAEKEVTQAQEALSKAKKAQTEREETVQQKQKAADEAQTGLKEAQGKPEETVQQKQKAADEAQTALKEAQSSFETGKNKVESLETVHQEAVKNRDAIQDSLEEIRAEATTEGAGQFSSIPIQRNQLDAKATTAIADAVTRMVKAVLDQDYTLESCTALITDHYERAADTEGEDANIQKDIRQVCEDLVRAEHNLRKAEAQRKTAEAQRKAAETILEPCSFDEFGEKIEEELGDDPGQVELREKLEDWLDDRGHPPLIFALYGCQYASLREELYKEFFPNN